MEKREDLQITELDIKNISVILTMFDTMLERDKKKVNKKQNRSFFTGVIDGDYLRARARRGQYDKI